MNEHEVEDLLVRALIEQERVRHQAILDDPERLAYYRSRPWWTEEFVSIRAEDYENGVEWGEIHYGFSKVTVDDTIVEVVHTEGGTEGGGEYTEVVIKLTLPDGTVEYWKKVGFYASHCGTDWDGEFSSVNPRQKTVTVYE